MAKIKAQEVIQSAFDMVASAASKRKPSVEVEVPSVDDLEAKFRQIYLTNTAKTAPEIEIVGKTTQKPKQGQISASQSEVACIPCAIGHFSTCSGLVSDEAVRFARRHGIHHDEVIDRLCACDAQLNAMERRDLAVEKIANLEPWQKELAIYAQNQSADIRHKLNNISTAEDLEAVSLQINEVHRHIAREWHQHKRGKPMEDKGYLPTLEEAQAEAARLAQKKVEKLWKSQEKK